MKNNNVVCPICGIPFHCKPRCIRKQKTVCCSMACSKEMRKIRMTGTGNHQYGKRGHLNASFKQVMIKKKNNSQVDYWIYLPEHPFANKTGRVKWHRRVVEENNLSFNAEFFFWIDGKPYLRPELVVHHKDGDHDNNDVNNLQVVTKSEHSRIHNLINQQKRDIKSGRFVKSNKVKFKLLSNMAKKPYQATPGSAGYDMFAARIEDRGDNIVYFTDVATEIPDGHAGLLLSRSSIVKTGLHLGNGVGLLDRDFRGNISFVFYKRDNCKLYEIGDRIGQLVVFPIPKIEFVEVNELSETDRGTGGYGSTGR